MQDNFLATISSDWRYERALQGIQLLAQHHLGHLVQSLIAWRQNVNEDIKKNYSQNNVVNVQGVCKRVSCSIINGCKQQPAENIQYSKQAKNSTYKQRSATEYAHTLTAGQD